MDEKRAEDRAEEFYQTEINIDEIKFKKSEISSGKVMAVLSYILPFIPYLVEKDNKYVRFHAVQGMNLLVVLIVYSIFSSAISSIIKVKGSCGTWLGYDLGNYCTVTPWWVILPLSLIGLVISVIAFIGIVNACSGKGKELPFVNRIKVFKR